jgi:diacylglycerol kinase family enzyme
MGASGSSSGGGARTAALLAILLLLTVAVWTLAIMTEHVVRFLVQLVLIPVVALSAWFAVTRRALRRAIALVVAIGAVAGFVVAGAVEHTWLVSMILRVLLLILAVGLARYAIARDIRSLEQSEPPGTPVPAAARGVLIMNLKSGGGKAERYRLVDECRERGIEPIVLRPGDDLLQLAQDAADRGADVIGMAGGDGSQALVASVAAARGLPMVVVPAGTRNHLALDLGLDREDVVGALDAFGDAVERRMDLADVNGRVFVNNVSLGLYAAIVRSPAYRDSKVDTTLATIPEALAPGAAPFDLRYRGPDGAERQGAHLIQVSNNPYGSTLATMGSRPRLDTGRLGIVALRIDDDRAAAAFLAALGAGHPERFRGLVAWASPTFEVSSGAPIDVGLDGETLEMDPPLSFSIRPDPLRVRLPPHAIGYSPAARAMGLRSEMTNLWRTATGRPAVIGS